MLKRLEEALAQLPELLEDPTKWESLIINRRKPHTYRVFTYLPNGDRISLHKFETCDTHEAFLHPHPWPAAFKILNGSYEMIIGHSEDRESKMREVAKFTMTKDSQYEIVKPLTWHNVVPLQTTYTVMVNGAPWDKDYAHVSIRTTVGKDLEKMPEAELLEHLAKFKQLIVGNK